VPCHWRSRRLIAAWLTSSRRARSVCGIPIALACSIRAARSRLRERMWASTALNASRTVSLESDCKAAATTGSAMSTLSELGLYVSV